MLLVANCVIVSSNLYLYLRHTHVYTKLMPPPNTKPRPPPPPPPPPEKHTPQNQIHTREELGQMDADTIDAIVNAPIPTYLGNSKVSTVW